MSILQEFVIVVFVIYAFECVMYIRRHHVAFAVNILGQARVLKPGLRLSNVAPFPRLYVVSDRILYLTKNGIYLPKHHVRKGLPFGAIADYTFLPYSGVTALELRDKTVIINHSHKLIHQTSAAPEHLLAFMQTMVKADPNARAGLIEKETRRATDISLIRDTVRRARRELRLPRYSGAILLTMLLAVFPAWVLSNGAIRLNIPVFLAVLIASYVATVALFIIAAKKLHAKTDVAEIAQVILNPVGISHSLSSLTAPLLSSCDNVAAALVFLKGDRLLTFLRRRYNMLLVSLSKDIPEDLSHQFRITKECYLDIFRQQGISEKDLLSVNMRGEDSRAFCPLCFAEYVDNVETCSDCKIPLTITEKAS
jgi:hypothetical protein